MATSLVLAFKTTEGKICNIKINDPKEGVTRTEAVAVMNDIIVKNVFETSTGARLSAVESVYTVVTTKSEVLA